MSLVILWGGRLPVVRIARLAGQYAKPRSKPTEVVEVEVVDSTAEGGKRIEKREVGSYRGDNVNGIGSTRGILILIEYSSSCCLGCLAWELQF